MAESDFSGPCIIGFGSSPSRCGPARSRGWSAQKSPGSRTWSLHTCQGLRPRRVGLALAFAHPATWPSAVRTASASRNKYDFRGSMAGLCVPLPTLRRHTRGCLRTAQGQNGSLHLHSSGFAPPTPCRFPSALSHHTGTGSRKTKMKHSTFIRFGLCPDPPAMQGDDTVNGCESNPGSFIITAVMESLKWSK